MFGLGTWEIAIIMLVALLVLGPDRLPQLARTIGKGLREVRRATNDLRLNLEIDDDDVRPRPVSQRAPDPGGLTPVTPPRPDPYQLEAEAEAESATENATEVETSKPAATPADPGDGDKQP